MNCPPTVWRQRTASVLRPGCERRPGLRRQVHLPIPGRVAAGPRGEDAVHKHLRLLVVVHDQPRLFQPALGPGEFAAQPDVLGRPLGPRRPPDGRLVAAERRRALFPAGVVEVRPRPAVAGIVERVPPRDGLLARRRHHFPRGARRPPAEERLDEPQLGLRCTACRRGGRCRAATAAVRGHPSASPTGNRSACGRRPGPSCSSRRHAARRSATGSRNRCPPAAAAIPCRAPAGPTRRTAGAWLRCRAGAS